MATVLRSTVNANAAKITHENISQSAAVIQHNTEKRKIRKEKSGINLTTFYGYKVVI